MGRYGMQSFGVMVVVSLSMLVLLNQHAAFVWSSASLSAAVDSKAASTSYGMGNLHGAERRRGLLQTVAPAPAPSSSGSGVYIGYGVLTAGYVPCPPQTGRSYYTSNCDSASGPVNPYTRGCSSITSCARS